MTHTELNTLIDKLNLRRKWTNQSQMLHFAQGQHVRTHNLIEYDYMFQSVQSLFTSLMNKFYYETPALGKVHFVRYTMDEYTGQIGNEWTWTLSDNYVGEWPKYPIKYIKGYTTYQRESYDTDYSSSFTPVQHTVPNAWKSKQHWLPTGSWNGFFDSIGTFTNNLKWLAITPSETKYEWKRITYNSDGTVLSDDSTSGIVTGSWSTGIAGDFGTATAPLYFNSTGLYSQWQQRTYSARFENTKPWPIKIKLYYIKLPYVGEHISGSFGNTSIDYTIPSFTGTNFVDTVRSNHETINSFSNLEYSTYETVVQPYSKSEWIGPQTAGTYDVNSRINDFINYNSTRTHTGYANHDYHDCTFGQIWYGVAQYCEYIS